MLSELLRLCYWLRRLQFYPYMILSRKPCLGPASNYDLPLLFSIGSTITAAMETSVIQARCGPKQYLEGKDAQKSTLFAICPLLEKGPVSAFPCQLPSPFAVSGKEESNISPETSHQESCSSSHAPPILTPYPVTSAIHRICQLSHHHHLCRTTASNKLLLAQNGRLTSILWRRL